MYTHHWILLSWVRRWPHPQHSNILQWCVGQKVTLKKLQYHPLVPPPSVWIGQDANETRTAKWYWPKHKWNAYLILVRYLLTRFSSSWDFKYPVAVFLMVFLMVVIVPDGVGCCGSGDDVLMVIAFLKENMKKWNYRNKKKKKIQKE